MVGFTGPRKKAQQKEQFTPFFTTDLKSDSDSQNYHGVFRGCVRGICYSAIAQLTTTHIRGSHFPLTSRGSSPRSLYNLDFLSLSTSYCIFFKVKLEIKYSGADRVLSASGSSGPEFLLIAPLANRITSHL